MVRSTSKGGLRGRLGRTGGKVEVPEIVVGHTERLRLLGGGESGFGSSRWLGRWFGGCVEEGSTAKWGRGQLRRSDRRALITWIVESGEWVCFLLWWLTSGW